MKTCKNFSKEIRIGKKWNEGNMEYWNNLRWIVDNLHGFFCMVLLILFWWIY